MEAVLCENISEFSENSANFSVQQDTAGALGARL